MADKLKKYSKAHTRYYTANGTLVPGVTTVTGLLNKPALVIWANRLGLEGINTNDYVDKAAKIGTLIHYLVECHITKKTPELYGNELQLVSEKYKYGGSMDFYAKVDGELEILDFKSGKGIYDEHFLQVGGGYGQLAIENGKPFKRIRILNIGRNENEPFDEKVISLVQARKYFKIFKNLIDIYYLKKELGWR